MLDPPEEAPRAAGVSPAGLRVMFYRRRLALVSAISALALSAGQCLAQPEPFDFVRPTLDLVRADTMGSLIVAGVAGPGVAVEFLDGTIVVARAVANVEGAWAAVIGSGLAIGRHDLMLRITTADGRYQVLTDDRLPVEVAEEGGRRSVTWLGGPIPSADATTPAGPVVVEGEGNIALVGATAPDRRVTITFDGRELAGTTDGLGIWRVELGGEVAVGDHALTIVEHAAGGAIVAEADLTLTVHAGGGVELAVDLTPVMAAATPDAPRTAVVGPNDTLWDLAVRYYGDGMRYFDIYDANRAEIGRNPRSIYPGQVLLIP
jgi:hypothetical protein